MADEPVKLRCWPGCLAVLNSPNGGKENGRIVRVVRLATVDDEVYGYDWIATGQPSWVISPLIGEYFNFDYKSPFKLLPCRDSSLIPLPPKISTVIQEELVVVSA